MIQESEKITALYIESTCLEIPEKLIRYYLLTQTDSTLVKHKDKLRRNGKTLEYTLYNQVHLLFWLEQWNCILELPILSDEFLKISLTLAQYFILSLVSLLLTYFSFVLLWNNLKITKRLTAIQSIFFFFLNHLRKFADMMLYHPWFLSCESP